MFPCPKCANVPLINVNYNKCYLIGIKCKCAFNAIYTIDEYIHNCKKSWIKYSTCERVLSHYNKKAAKFCVNCNKWLCDDCLNSHKFWIKEHIVTDRKFDIKSFCDLHRENEIVFYCSNCNEHLCDLCYRTHQSHNIIKLEHYLNKDKMNRILKEYEKMKRDYSKYNEIKDKIINKLNDNILKIEKAYAKRDKKEKKIFALITMLFDSFNYAKNNYYISTNIQRNTIFNVPSFEMQYNTKNINDEYINKFISFISESYFECYQNIKVNEISNIKNIFNNSVPVISMCVLNNKKLASCSHDKKIKIYNIITSKLECEIEGHLRSITFISPLKDDKLISSSEDNTIRIWEIYDDRKYQCEAILEGHNNWILKAFAISKGRLCSCSVDKTIRIWRSEPPYQCIHVLYGHYAVVNSVIELNDTDCLVSGSSGDDRTLRFWNSSTYKMEYTIENVSCGWVESLAEVRDTLLVVGDRNMIIVIDIESIRVVKVIEDVELDYVRCFMNLGFGVFFGCSNGMIGVIDLDSLEISFKMKIHDKGIQVIKFIGKRSFVTGALDRMIRFWEIPESEIQYNMI